MSRTKDQWIERTGGFRIGETDAAHAARVGEIQQIEAKPNKTMADVIRLRELMGFTLPDEFDYQPHDE